ncbi:MAG: hypothetical protein HQL41_14885 [Alphaproteobacteria bacterium]|nr:hypothetical protein [Alphaproteobacteria bacterium]
MTVTDAALAEIREILHRAGRPIPDDEELVIMAEIRAIRMAIKSDADAPPKEK